ncbi:MAG: allantoinase AllB [Chloroflexi bacterium]|nr:allantoinase AllB [Chloroflexota bacterium]
MSRRIKNGRSFTRLRPILPRAPHAKPFALQPLTPRAYDAVARARLARRTGEDCAVKADLLIAGGTLVSEHEAVRADVAVVGGRVAAILDPSSAVEAERRVDATGKLVLPGLVDGHVHFNEPGRIHWEGFATGSAAAAAGGITTVLDMPLNNDPPTLDGASLALKAAAVADKSVVDYGLWGGIVPANLGQLGELHAGGVVAAKAFMCHSGLDGYPGVDDASLYGALRRGAELGMTVGLHAESDGLTTALGGEAQAAGQKDARAWASARPPFTELEPVRRALLLARETGASVHFVHVSTPEAVREVAAARAHGVRATLETCPHYLALDEDDLARLGPYGKCAPPLRPRAVVEALWQEVLAGRVDLIASDHSPCPPADKDRGHDDIWLAWGGLHGVQTLLPVLLTEGVHARGLSLKALVRLTSAATARRYGLYPQKGALLVGSDADIAIVDPDAAWTLDASMLKTRWPLSPFLGKAFRGRVCTTILRGTVVCQDGEIQVQPGFGQRLFPASASSGCRQACSP